MKYDATNKGLEMELVIRTRGYHIILDVSERVVSLAKMKETSDWHISLQRRDGRCAAC